MEGFAVSVGLGWLGVGVGAAGCVALYLMAGGSARTSIREDAGDDRRIARLSAAATLVLTVIFWAIAMQHREPFSAGQGLAFGFLIGGLSGAAAILLSLRLSELAVAGTLIRVKRLAGLSNVFYALFAVSLAYSLFAGNPWEPLMGFAMGAAMAAILHTYMQYVSSTALPIRTETWAFFAITIAVAVLLSMKHFDATQLRMWWPLPILISTTVLVANYLAVELSSLGRFRENGVKSYVCGVMISVVLIAGLSALYSWRIVHTWQLLEVVAVGLGIGALIAWLASSLVSSEGAAGGIEAGAACVLLVIAFAVAAFKLWSGLGIALGLIAAWAIASPALGDASEDRDNRTLGILPDAVSWALYPLLMILLFRLFLGRYAHDLRATDLQIHYTFIGAMLGAVLPFVLTGSVMRLRDARAGGSAIAGVALMGLVAAASPLLLFALWQAKAVMGFSFGLTAATAFMLLSRLSDGDIKYSIGLLAVAAQLTAIQFVQPLLNVELTRFVRVSVLAGVVVLAVLWLGLNSVLAARRAR